MRKVGKQACDPEYEGVHLHPFSTLIRGGFSYRGGQLCLHVPHTPASKSLSWPAKLDGMVPATEGWELWHFGVDGT